MRGPGLHEGDQVSVGTLFGYAVERVPVLARDIGGIQRPVLAVPSGGQSFPIGRLEPEDRKKVPLQLERPLLLRCNLQDEKRVRDHLGLGPKVDERLRSATAGRGAKLVFVDAGEFPGAHELAGRYQVKGNKVVVRLTLFKGEDEVARFTAEGDRAKLDDLARKIVEETQRRLSAPSK
jgi:hypothetical protein